MQPGYYIRTFRARNLRPHPMINSVSVLLTALVVFAFGYRFFSKFLAIRVFRPGGNYSTPAAATADSVTPVTAHRYAMLMQYGGSLAAPVTIIGITLAVAWGWVAVFLWVIVGSVVAAGTCGMGIRWLAPEQHTASGAGGLARDLRSNGAATLVLGLFIGFAVLVNAVMALSAGGILVAYPASTIPLLLLGVFAFAIGRLAPRQSVSARRAANPVAMGAILLALWVFHATPVRFAGEIQIQSAFDRALTLDPHTAWIVLATGFAWYCARQPSPALAAPFETLGTGLLAVTMVLLFVAILIAHPVLVAPTFHAPGGAPPVLPWLFLIAASGALGAWNALAATGAGPGKAEPPDWTRLLGYGGAIAEAVIGLGAIIIGTTAFSSRQTWLHTYGSWSGLGRLDGILRIYISGFAGLAHALHISIGYASSLAALTLLGLCISGLVTGLRIQRRALEELAGRGVLPRSAVTRILACGAVATALLAAQESRADILAYWPLLGSASITAAVALLTLLLLALAQQHRPLAAVLWPQIFAAAAGFWAQIMELVQFWTGHQWASFSVSLALLLIQVSLLAQAGSTLYRLPPRRLS